MTFSAGIRRELVDRFSAREKSQEWALASFAVFSALSGSIDQNEEGWRVTIRVTGSHIASMLEDIAKSLSLPICEKKTGRRDISLTFVVSVERRALLFFDFDRWWEWTGEQGLEVIFSSFFLACGVMSDPTTGRYRLAFSPYSAGSISLMKHLFSCADLNPRESRHQGKQLLFFSKGEDIAQFLLLCGAHLTLLRFEELRSERELLGQVNRLVNFDEANASRRAQSISEQLSAIDTIERIRGIDSLAPALAEAAKARLENRGASLEELGAGMVPPVSKSGMSHRFAKIRSLAHVLESKERREQSER
jgi:DNA-binding transcriptional regulator WhiA